MVLDSGSSANRLRSDAYSELGRALMSMSLPSNGMSGEGASYAIDCSLDGEFEFKFAGLADGVAAAVQVRMPIHEMMRIPKGSDGRSLCSLEFYPIEDAPPGKQCEPSPFLLSAAPFSCHVGPVTIHTKTARRGSVQPNILGVPFLESTYVVFDQDNLAVYMAPKANCVGGSSNIIPIGRSANTVLSTTRGVGCV